MSNNRLRSDLFVRDLHTYARELIARGAPVLTAEKVARINARPGIPGERIVSWSVDAAGGQLMEMEARVSEDPETGIPGWVASKVDASGNVLIDSNGHPNQWIIDDATFRRKYEPVAGHPGIYKPVGGLQRFVQVEQAIHVTQWGKEFRVDEGGYINITVPGDSYVISGRDFSDTYRIV